MVHGCSKPVVFTHIKWTQRRPISYGIASDLCLNKDFISIVDEHRCEKFVQFNGSTFRFIIGWKTKAEINKLGFLMKEIIAEKVKFVFNESQINSNVKLDLIFWRRRYQQINKRQFVNTNRINFHQIKLYFHPQYHNIKMRIQITFLHLLYHFWDKSHIRKWMRKEKFTIANQRKKFNAFLTRQRKGDEETMLTFRPL